MKNKRGIGLFVMAPQVVGLIAVIVFVFGIRIALSFSEPTKTPPSENAPAPLNVSMENQSKADAPDISKGWLLMQYLGTRDVTLLATRSGNVGVGNTNPLSKLDVTGGIHATQDICTDLAGGKCLSAVAGSAGLWAANGANISNTNSGNVGIGITNPAQELQVSAASGSNADIRISGNGQTANYMDVFHGASDQGLWGVGPIDMRFGTNGNERIRITAAGNVGIGATNPGEQLELLRNGGNSVLRIHHPGVAEYKIGIGSGESILRIVNANGGNPITSYSKGVLIDVNGNVGIDDTAFNAKLRVNGNAAANQFLDRDDFTYYLDPNNPGTSGKFAGLIETNGANVPGGGIKVADDGGFYDYNNGWIDFRGSHGIRILNEGGGYDAQRSIRAGALCINDDCRTGWPGGGIQSESDPVWVGWRDNGARSALTGEIRADTLSACHGGSCSHLRWYGDDSNYLRGTTYADGLLFVRDNNLRIDNAASGWKSEIQSAGQLYLHPDVDRTGDDAVIFTNSDGNEVARLQDGNFSTNGVIESRRATDGCNSGILNLWDTTNDRGWHITNRRGCEGSLNDLKFWFWDGGAWHNRVTFGNGGVVETNPDNVAGGGIKVADDGGFYDYNNGWIDFRGSHGIRILNEGGGYDAQRSIRAGALCINDDCRTGWPGAAATPNLQQVTDVGATTNRSIATAGLSASGDIDNRGHVTYSNRYYDDDTNYYIDANTDSKVSTIFANNWFRAEGNTGFYFQNWGGGWFMQDATWIRAYNDKNVYTPGEIRAGTIRAEGNLCIGADCKSSWSQVGGGIGSESDPVWTGWRDNAGRSALGGEIRADTISACRGGSCSHLRWSGDNNNYLRGPTYHSGDIIREGDWGTWLGGTNHGARARVGELWGQAGVYGGSGLGLNLGSDAGYVQIGNGNNLFVGGVLGVGDTETNAKLRVNGAAAANVFLDREDFNYYLDPNNPGISLLVRGAIHALGAIQADQGFQQGSAVGASEDVSVSTWCDGSFLQTKFLKFRGGIYVGSFVQAGASCGVTESPPPVNNNCSREEAGAGGPC